MRKKEKGAIAPESVSGWCGSTNVMFDCYLDDASSLGVAFNPEKLDLMVQEKIKESGMIRRKGLLDVWESKHRGPCTSFHSLQESHVRLETWPAELHVQGETQLCNYSRDNSGIAIRLTESIVKQLRPHLVYARIIKRGPGPDMSFRELTVVRQRGVLVFAW